MTIGLTHFLLLGLALFSIGIFGVLSSRNIIRILMSIELMLNAVNINFVAFSRYCDGVGIKGQVFAIFIIAIIAAETAVGLAILLSLYRNKKSVDIDDNKQLKG